MNKNSPCRYFWLILLALLTACGQPPASAIPRTVDVNAISTQAAGTAIARMTQISATKTIAALPPTATSTETPWPTITPRPTPTPGPTLPPLPLVTVEGLRVAYIFSGNLYVQDSGKELLQLTNSGKDHYPIFSEDGKKIVFTRDFNTIYSINPDGSQEQELVTPAILGNLGLGYTGAIEPVYLDFLQDTHNLLFIVRDSGKLDNRNLFLVNTDNAEIKKFSELKQAELVQISSNEKLAVIKTAENISVIKLDGTMLYHNLAAIPATFEDVYGVMTQWTQDWSKLFYVPLAPKAGAKGGYLIEPRALWQFSMNNGAAHEIHLSPPLMGDMFSISPDGNWVVYTYIDPLEETKDKETKPYGIYLANLRNGTTQFLGDAGLDSLPSYYSWSSDSAHFIFENANDKMYLGDVHGEITPLNSYNFLNWIDSSRYLCLYRGLTMGEIGKDEIVRVVDFSALDFEHFNHLNFVFVKPNTGK